MNRACALLTSPVITEGYNLMPLFPISPDVVVVAASDSMIHLSISIVTEGMVDSLRKAIILEKLLNEMIELGLIIKPSHEVRDNGK
jgi:hypothetical protein